MTNAAMTDQVGQRPPPVFVLALTERSGTNYLRALLEPHPVLARSAIPEDALLRDASLLGKYADDLFGHWSSLGWFELIDAGRFQPERLMASFGQALLDFVDAPGDGRRAILKTPRVGDAETAFRLFPGCHVLVLVRDPRSIAASIMRADWYQGHGIEALAARWAERMREFETLLRSQQDEVRAGRLRIVRYEKLVADPVGETGRILDAIGVERDPGTLAQAARAPVIGSSFLPRNDLDKVDFRPKEAPDGFDPRIRFGDWPIAYHRRFNRIAGALMQRWGYPMVTATGGEPAGEDPDGQQVRD